MKVGQRLLLCEKGAMSRYIVPHEARVLELSPSGDHVKLEFPGGITWRKTSEYRVVEVLEEPILTSGLAIFDLGGKRLTPPEGYVEPPTPPHDVTAALRELKGVPVDTGKLLDELRTRIPPVRNVAECGKCGDVIESKSRHDFRKCECGESFVDGGPEYSRWGGDARPARFCEDCGEPGSKERNDPRADAEGRDQPVDLCEDCYMLRKDDVR